MKLPIVIKFNGPDVKFTYFSGSGAGGQFRNKHKNCVRVQHIPSGAIGECKEHRSLEQNKKTALQRLTKNKKFKLWAKMEVAARLEGYANLERKVDDMMRPENLKIEMIGEEDEVH